MSQSGNAVLNRRFLLASRPHGTPEPANFRLETEPVPEPRDGQVLVRTLYLSLDPYMRTRMNDQPSYRPPVAVGEVMVGETVSRVVASRHDGFKVGDLVLGFGGWQSYAVSDGAGLTRLPPDIPHPSYALGVLGMPGFTAWYGLLKIGAPKPGDTVVVAAASGAVGSVVGQIAKIEGCRVIGVAGGAKKCAHVVTHLGFDGCVDHRDPEFARKLAKACPDGVDIYFENVGGQVFDAVLPLLNIKARVPVCGLVAHYNDTDPPVGPDRLPVLLDKILRRRLKLQGFIILDHYEALFGKFYGQMSAWLRDGRVRFFEDVVDGLENAPGAFIGMLQGKNNGKLVIRVAD